MNWISKIKTLRKPGDTEDLKSLVASCIANNRSAQEKLYRSYFDIAYSTCRKHTQDEEKVIEIVNNAFLKIFKNLESFTFQGSFEGWIRRITFNCLSDYFRSEKRRLRFIEIDGVDGSYEADQMNDMLEGDILNLIEALPDTPRKVFIHYAIEGYSHKEIAEKLEIAEGTSKWQLSEARKELRRKLNNPDGSLRSSSI